MDRSEEQPLVTVICLTYKQERFVREAVLSLLNQDYNNLEIIISDDCSPDKTFEVINNTIASAQSFHSIHVRRTERNLGLGLHLEEVLRLAKGEYFVLAAGDDVSCHARVKNMIGFIASGGFQYKAAFSNLAVINASSARVKDFFKEPPVFARDLNEFKQGKSVWAVGASLVIHRSLYDKYNGFVSGTFQEDGCFAFRAMLEGGVGYYDEITVCYRVHDSNVSQNLSLKKEVEFKRGEYVLWNNYLKDSLLYNANDDALVGRVLRGRCIALLKRRLLSFYLLSYFMVSFKRLVRI